jgi:ankyrin repeat protein
MWATESKRAGLDVLQTLIAHGADLNAVSHQLEITPLRLAAKTGALDKVQLLVGAGADIGFRSSQGYTPVIDAARHAAVVRYLIGAGADLDSVSTCGCESALSVASGWGAFDVIRQLLDAGATPEPLKWTELMRDVALAPVRELPRALRRGADLRVRDRWHRTPWLISLVAGSMGKARVLLDAGADFSDTGNCGEPALSLACYRDNALLVRWLLDRGADPNATNDFGWRPLMMAAEHDAADALGVLLKAGARVDAADDVGMQAIHYAESSRVTEVLLNAGADVNVIDGTGDWPLRAAATRGDAQLVRDLLAWGARVDTTSSGETALHEAVFWDQVEIAQLLLEAGANPNALDVDDWTPLNMVWSVEAARLLRAAGARPCRPTPFQVHDSQLSVALEF